MATAAAAANKHLAMLRRQWTRTRVLAAQVAAVAVGVTVVVVVVVAAATDDATKKQPKK